ncbi:MAG: NAD-dependent epimerase/dehydratase family protein [Candidatus Edwardsbacteria bacterium]|nr:NAD-dependent epimerase/dehydratase family protein [Candidatus Edwardsbacteria bacterium]
MIKPEEKSLALLTGASGFIGSHLAEGLLEKGFRVRALVRTASNLRWLKGLDLELAYGSFDDQPSLYDAVSGADYIFHLAAAKSGSRDRIFHHNVEATVNLAKAAIENAPGIRRFVFSSSQAAAGPSDRLEEPRCESHQCRPISDYGRSKLEAERQLLKLAEQIPITIVRPPTVYGPRDTDVLLYFQWINRGLALLPGFKKRYAHLIFVGDLAQGMVAAARSDAAAGKTYFLSHPQSHSWQEISWAIARSLNKKPLPLMVPLGLANFAALLAEGGALATGGNSIFNRQKVREMSQKYWTCSPGRAQKDFGFNCRYDLKRGLEITARWYRENDWL